MLVPTLFEASQKRRVLSMLRVKGGLEKGPCTHILARSLCVDREEAGITLNGSNGPLRSGHTCGKNRVMLLRPPFYAKFWQGRNSMAVDQLRQPLLVSAKTATSEQ